MEKPQRVIPERLEPTKEIHSISTDRNRTESRTLEEHVTSKLPLEKTEPPLSLGDETTSVFLPLNTLEYADFLNAVASSDPHHLYEAMVTSEDPMSLIQRTGKEGCYTYTAMTDDDDTYITLSRMAAIRYCNWKENGEKKEPSSDITEQGTYTLKDDIVVTVNREASCFLDDRKNSTSFSHLGFKMIPDNSLVAGLSSKNTVKKEALITPPIKEPDKIKNSMQEDLLAAAGEQQKWEVHQKKATLKISSHNEKLSARISLAKKTQFQWQQKADQWRQQLPNIKDETATTIRDLISHCETVAVTAKLTGAILEAGKKWRTSSHSSQKNKAEEVLLETRQWALLTPQQREREFGIALQRNIIEATTTFEGSDAAWKQSDKKWHALSKARAEEDKATRLTQKMRVTIHQLQDDISREEMHVSDLIDSVSEVGNLLGQLDVKIAIPTAIAQQTALLVTHATSTACSAALKGYLEHIIALEKNATEKVERAIEDYHNTQQTATLLEKKACAYDAQETISKAITAKATSPVTESITWKIWEKRVEQSNQVVQETTAFWEKKIAAVNILLIEKKHLLEQAKTQYTTVAKDLEAVRKLRRQAQQNYNKLAGTPGERSFYQDDLDSAQTALEAAYHLSNKHQELSRLAHLEKEQAQHHVDLLVEGIRRLQKKASRAVARTTALTRNDSIAWFTVWPDRGTLLINQENADLDGSRDVTVTEFQKGGYRHIIQKIAAIQAAFTRMESSWDAFSNAFATHLKNNNDKSAAIASDIAQELQQTAMTTATAILALKSIKDIPGNAFESTIKMAPSAVKIPRNFAKATKAMADEITYRMNPSPEPRATNVNDTLTYLKVCLKDIDAQVSHTLWEENVAWVTEKIELLLQFVQLLDDRGEIAFTER